MQDYTQLAQTLNHYLSALTIVSAIAVSVATLFVLYFAYNKPETLSKYAKTLGTCIFPAGFLITLGGMFLTLFYSQVLGYAPCDLCWYQRVFLYPQVFMFAYAWYKKDRNVLPYTLLLSLLGLAVAVYHHMLQIGFDIMKPCSTAPFAVDCAKPSFIEFGFVTFPFMAVVLFAFLSLLMIASMRFKK